MAGQETLGKVIVGVVMTIVMIYVVSQIGIVIGDRFTTSDVLAINATLNPEGAAAQDNINDSFYDNIEFTDILVFMLVAGAALYALKFFGIW